MNEIEDAIPVDSENRSRKGGAWIALASVA
jgi:hypothetical protein